MDFLDPQKKRAYHIRLFIGYALIGIALLMSTFFLVLATSGYGVSRKTGQIIQNGLLFVDSKPVASRIYINGEDRGTTDGRFILEEGDYKVALKQDGYRDWQHDITLSGAGIERLTYPFLFPKTPVGRDVQTLPSPIDVASSSPDRRWIVMHDKVNAANFTVFDTSSKDSVPILQTVPSTVLVARPNLTLEAIEWSSDNRHLLLKATADDGVQFIVFDRQAPAESINVNDVFGHSFAQVNLYNKLPDRLYVYDSSGLLQIGDVAKKSLNVVANHVRAFKPYGSDTLLYITDNTASTTQVDVKLLSGTSTYAIRTLPVSDRYLLDYASYAGKQYAVVGTRAESRVYIYEDPVDSAKKATTAKPATVKALLKVPDGANYVSFSASAQFVALQGETNFAVYDIKQNRQNHYKASVNITPGQKATWMDAYRLMLVSKDNKLSIFDFDGTNLQELVGAYAGYVPAFDRDYTAMFTVSPSVSQKDVGGLVRTDLIVK